MRLFVAFDVPPQVRSAMERVQAQLSGVRPTPLDDAHITLKFLGEIEDAEDIRTQLRTIRAHAPRIVLDRLAGFPSDRSARVFYLGGPRSDAFDALATQIDAALAEIPRDYPPHAHVSVARTREPSRVPSIPIERMVFVPDSFGLYRSDKGPVGYRHTLVESYPFVTRPRID